MLSASDLASTLGLSKVRISQLTSSGRLDGCWQGEGRARRYDLGKVAVQLGRTLDPGQMMGNGAATKGRIKDILADVPGEDVAPKPAAPVQREGGELSPMDGTRYDMARTLKAEEEARRLRRVNQEAEGHFVLASEVAHQTSRLIAQEIAEVEAVLRDGARAIADRLGVDFKTARKILVDTWRAHRSKRTDQLEAQAASASMSEVEEEGNF